MAFLLVYLRPYHGIRHDSVLYLGQALLRWQPEQFSTDLFFAYGGQTDYTVFPWVMAWLLQRFTAAELFLALTLLGLFLFLAASYALLRQLMTSEYRLVALLALLILPSGYGGRYVFSYAEPFFSARSMAEPLVLFSLAAWLANRHLLSVLLGVCAFALHPLQALILPLLAYAAAIWKDRRWLHLIWLALPFFFIGDTNTGLAVIDRIFARYDSEWHGWISKVNAQTLLYEWQYPAWAFWLTDLFLGWLIIQRATGALRDVARFALLATILGMLATLVLTDMSWNVLATGLQLWRAQWLLHWLAMASVPWLLILEYRDTGKITPRWALLLAIVAVGMPLMSTGMASLAVLFMIPLYLTWHRAEKNIGGSTRRLLAVFPYVLMALILMRYGLSILATLEKTGRAREAVRPEFLLFSYPMICSSLLAGGLWLWRRFPSARSLLTAFLAVLVFHAAWEWDRRSTWTRYIESAQYSLDRFGVTLETAAQVFWEGELLAPWLVLNRPSFFNGHQSAGILFSRATAAEVNRRHERMQPYIVQRGICHVVNELTRNQIDQGLGQAQCIPDVEIFKGICSPGGPDYLVLEEKLPFPVLGSWSIIGGIKGDQPITYWLYRCRDIQIIQEKI